MSSYNYGEEHPEAPSDSFYEIGQYKRTVTRVDNGNKQCDELAAFLKERAMIEENYCKNIKAWGTKYTKILEKGSCYHTLQEAWGSMIKASEKIAEMHLTIAKEVTSTDVEEVKTWKKSNYRTLTLGGLKETKNFADEFSKAQKPWAKLYKKVVDAKKSYYNACKEEKSAQTQENTAKSDSTLPPEKVKKLQELVEKKGLERQKQKDKYESALSDLDAGNSRYMEEMDLVFTKCQDFEHDRLTFFKKILLSAEGHLDISSRGDLKQLYGNVHNSLTRADVDSDLEWWRKNHGPGMAMNWPVFEEYDSERIHMQRNISKKQSAKASKHVAGVDAIGTAQFTQNDEFATSYPANNAPDEHTAAWSDDEQSNPFADHDVEGGVPVQALYDYEGAEEDELSFSAGDRLYRLEDEDEQGWCKGKTEDGKVGLYPANYMKDL